MHPFEVKDAHPVHLSATLPASDNRRRIHLVLLHDDAGFCFNRPGSALTTDEGGIDHVEAQRLANAVRGSGIRLAFLCSCRSAVAGRRTLSGIGQLLLSPSGGDLSTVIATQANLPVHRSAELAAGFYRQLAAESSRGHPADPRTA